MSGPRGARVRFGECAFDREARELRRSGRTVPLSPKAFQLLELLVEARPRALSKAEIHDRLWPRTAVADSSLARVVTELRNALEDDARESRFVRTVYGFGYAFSGEVREQHAGGRARFLVTCGAREIPLAEGENILGRAEDATVWIDSSRVSRHHARIVISGEEALLEDLDSKNGTYLRGRRVARPERLTNGDEITVGSVFLVFRALGGSDSTDTDTGA